MRDSTLEQFTCLKQQLAQERDSIISRLADINAVLGAGEAVSAPSRESSDSQLTRKAVYTPREGSLPAKILAALGKAGDCMRVKDIAIAVKGSPMLVSQACAMLRRKRALKRRGRGSFALP
jgi:hypothetical protein